MIEIFASLSKKQILSSIRCVLGSFSSARGFWAARALNSACYLEAQKSNVQAESVAANVLEQYFDEVTEGPGIWKWRHYFEIYHRHLHKFIGQDVHLLEVGIYSGGSLQMWQHYLGPECQIYGVDIEEACRAYESEAVNIFIGDQADRQFWSHFKKNVPSLDIIIDDGGHAPRQQIVTLEELISHLRPGGVYICEDVHGSFNQFAQYINGFCQNLNQFGVKPGQELACSPTQFQSQIHSVHMYPYVVVIEKTSRPVTEFIAPKHGTQWQPFL
jgi:23S rRNA U2552 (ribose-2'-O)-methylase RlmE/FtsJ